MEVGMLIIRPEVKEHSISLIGEKLKAVAVASAAYIDGNQYKQLDFTNPDVEKLSSFQNIRTQLQKVKTNLNLKENIYTLNLINSNTAIFGVMTNEKPHTGDTLQLISKTARNAIDVAYVNQQCIYTDIYKDQYGTWMSGVAPILDGNKKVVGIIQVDNSISTVQTILARIDNPILLVRILLIPLSIIVSIIIAFLFTKPLNETIKRINKISLGDYSENKKIKSGGEVKELTKAAENLRTTILEQQEKIFKTISDLEKSRDKAQASDRLKSEFLAVISHEIRTPLNVILGNIEVLKLELDEDEIRELEDILEPIKIGSTRLIRTVEMLVLYSELVSGSYVNKEEYVNLNDLFFNTVDKYKKEAASKGLKIKYECNSTTGMLKTDSGLLEETIVQFVDNAVKFSNKGELLFSILDNKDEGVSLVIKDEGIGISEEFMSELFKPFSQEDMSYERKFEGNGLGLALAKKCSDFNGFDLKIQSKKGSGTTIEINIPRSKFFGG
jgi:signal transduction histidine kinase